SGCDLRLSGLKAWQAVEPTTRFAAFNHGAASKLLCDQPLSVYFPIHAGSTDAVAGAKVIKREGAQSVERVFAHSIAPICMCDAIPWHTVQRRVGDYFLTCGL